MNSAGWFRFCDKARTRRDAAAVVGMGIGPATGTTTAGAASLCVQEKEGKEGTGKWCRKLWGESSPERKETSSLATTRPGRCPPATAHGKASSAVLHSHLLLLLGRRDDGGQGQGGGDKEDAHGELHS